MKWTDAEDIGIALAEKFPDLDPLTLRFTDLRERMAVTFIAVQQGYEAHATPEGVSRATTRTVVMASLAVLGLDFVLTAMMFSI